jgi:hypothetical protein
MKRILFALLTLLFWNTLAIGAIIGEPVMYEAGNSMMTVLPTKDPGF